MSEFLNEKQADIEHRRTMLHELRYLQVCLTVTQ